MTLEEFFKENKRLALAFSGGVDSAYLLYAGIKYGCDICAFYVKSEFQPQFEYEDALRLAHELGAKMKVIELSVLDDDLVCENGPKRCYFCKKRIFNSIAEAAKEAGYGLLVDGTNASDDAGDRPGMQALKELMVRSPLRECNLTKQEIRDLSKEAGLFTWDKPAYACLATRIPVGSRITGEDLTVTEQAEGVLFDMGFSDFRIRKTGDTAKLQLKKDQLAKLLEQREEVIRRLKPYYKNITVDLEVRNG